MASALVMFVGGMAIVFFYPGNLEYQYRVLIALFVSLYFLLRVGQSIFAIKRDRLSNKAQLDGLIERENDDS
jgi:hypothetical protein